MRNILFILGIVYILNIALNAKCNKIVKVNYIVDEKMLAFLEKVNYYYSNNYGYKYSITVDKNDIETDIDTVSVSYRITKEDFEQLKKEILRCNFKNVTYDCKKDQIVGPIDKPPTEYLTLYINDKEHDINTKIDMSFIIYLKGLAPNIDYIDDISIDRLNKFNKRKFYKDIIFSDNSYAIEEKAKNTLSSYSYTLKQYFHNYKIEVVGHTDIVGSKQQKYYLGIRRAKAVKDVLVNYGIDSARIVLQSVADEKQICTKNTKKCQTKNRRVQIKFIEKAYDTNYK